jgi:ferrous iron transport protein B
VNATPQRVLMLGPPNAGKSTLFGALTGTFAEIGNYPGTTVERASAPLTLDRGTVQLVDLPGTISLAAHSPDEAVAVAELVSAMEAEDTPVVLFVADAPRLSRSLYLLLQVLELELPVVVALNLVDEAEAAGTPVDVLRLTGLTGVEVVPTVARTGEGLDALRGAVSRAAAPEHVVDVAWPPTVEAAVNTVLQTWKRAGTRSRALARWALLSEAEAIAAAGLPPLPRKLPDVDGDLVTARYRWIDARLPELLGGGVETGRPAWSETADRWLLHPVSGGLTFLAVMGFVFWTLFAWADPFIGLIEDAVALVSDGVDAAFVAAGAEGTPLELLQGLLVDGILGGVGAVVVFVPQIALLFLFLSVLEDCGYLARAAHIMDRILRAAGLPGRAFVPLLSGFACAVPAILATRTMPRFRDRLLTMMVLPLTTCSARLPVYVLLTAALFPATMWGLPAQPLVLLAMYVLSAVLSVGAAILLGRLLLPAREEVAVLELPPYRLPSAAVVLRTTALRTGDFLREAGRVILAATVVLWALLSFPEYEPEQIVPPDILAELPAEGAERDEVVAQYALRGSYGGMLGRALEPVIEPLGYDWKIGIGLVGSFAAREVFVATMGVVYGIAEADEGTEGLYEAMRNDTRADGTPVFTPLVGASILVFFAIAMQCLSTLAVLRRETQGWRWPLFITAYLTALAWLSAFAVFQGGRLLGYG